ncbi:MAG: YkgJ family cysteine cluster protein [bacterium]|nr:YkgJ family cysteine cluster protein [bacterium]
MLENYEKYLQFITAKLNKFFEEQKPYIACKKGCAKCCKNAEFPYSLLEVNYLAMGIKTLDEKTQNLIADKIAKINKDKQNYKGEKFLYDCPFLFDDVCCLYEYRGLVCRTFGLIASTDSDKTNVPFCHEEGLNYSNVVDKEKNMITQEKVEALGFEIEPRAYNISYDFLTSEKTENAFDIKFGEKKPLIEWFKGIS